MTGNLGLSGSNLYDVNQVSASTVIATSFTGSLFGTASYAANANTASYALTSSLSLESRDIVLPVKNVTGTQINKGAVVRISGATGDNALISLADWTNDNSSANTLGLEFWLCND